MDRNKVLLIFGGAWLSALLLSWFLYSTTAGARQTRLKTVIAAARDIPAGVRLKKTDLKKVGVPDRDAPAGAAAAEEALLDHALLYPVAANEVITLQKVASAAGVEGVASIIPPGKRAVAVSVQDAASAAGLIQPRSRVDVLVSRVGGLSEAVSNLILQDITVLSVGRVTELQATAADQKGAAATAAVSGSAARAVTLLVSPEEAAKLELAKNNGRISLALRNPSDPSRLDDPQPTTGEVIDPLMGDRRDRLMQLRARSAAAGALPNANPNFNLRDDRAWAQLVAGEASAASRTPAPKKEPTPKPRAVVDVYRGDKHVQETFPH